MRLALIVGIALVGLGLGLGLIEGSGKLSGNYYSVACGSPWIRDFADADNKRATDDQGRRFGETSYTSVGEFRRACDDLDTRGIFGYFAIGLGGLTLVGLVIVRAITPEIRSMTEPPPT
jgi:hypothetical protein